MLNNKELQLEIDKDIQTQLMDGMVYAQEAGIVQKIKIQKGQSIGGGEEIIRLGDYSKGYLVSLKVDSSLTSIFCTVQVFVTKLPASSTIDKLTF